MLCKTHQIFFDSHKFSPCVFFTFSQIKQLFVFWPTAPHTRERPGGIFGVFVLTFQSQLVSGAPAICDGPDTAEYLMWRLNPDSINAGAL